MQICTWSGPGTYLSLFGPGTYLSLFGPGTYLTRVIWGPKLSKTAVPFETVLGVQNSGSHRDCFWGAKLPKPAVPIETVFGVPNFQLSSGPSALANKSRHGNILVPPFLKGLRPPRPPRGRPDPETLADPSYLPNPIRLSFGSRTRIVGQPLVDPQFVPGKVYRNLCFPSGFHTSRPPRHVF